VRAVATLCGARTDGLELRATAFEFAPGRIVAGDFRFDVGTAGSLTLLAQALLPVLASAPGPCTVRLIGGTDVRAAPPFDYFRQVLLAHLTALGVPVRCTLHRRLTLTPTEVRHFRVNRARPDEARWIAATLDRESRAFGTRVERTSDGELRLAPERGWRCTGRW
jgi:hypothetical protein